MARNRSGASRFGGPLANTIDCPLKPDIRVRHNIYRNGPERDIASIVKPDLVALKGELDAIQLKFKADHSMEDSHFAALFNQPMPKLTLSDQATNCCFYPI